MLERNFFHRQVLDSLTDEELSNSLTKNKSKTKVPVLGQALNLFNVHPFFQVIACCNIKVWLFEYCKVDESVLPLTPER